MRSDEKIGLVENKILLIKNLFTFQRFVTKNNISSLKV